MFLCAFRNEIYKFFKNRKNQILIIVVFILTFTFVFFQYKSSEAESDKLAHNYLSRSRLSEARYLSLKNQLDLILITEEVERDKIIKQIEFYTEDRGKLLVISNAYLEEKYDLVLNTQYLYYENLLKYIDLGVVKSDLLAERNTSIEEIRAYRDFYKGLIEKEYFSYFEPKVTSSSLLLNLINGNTFLVISIILILLVGDVYLSELKEGRYKLYYIQPIERVVLFNAKFLSSVFVMCSFLVVVLLCIFISGILIDGFGSFETPVLTFESSLTLNNSIMEMKLISTKHYIFMGLLLFIIIQIFGFLIMSFFSIISSNISISLFLTMTMMCSSYIINHFLNHMSFLTLYCPITYLYYDYVMQQKIRSNYDLGMLLLLGSSLLLYGISKARFMKKDFVDAID